MQWNALNLCGPCSSSSAHRRFQEWERAGVFHEIWRRGLLDYDEQVGIDWDWLAADGAITKGTAGRVQDRPQPHGQSEKGAKRSVLTEAAGVPVGLAHEGAHRHDQKLLAETLASIPIARPKPTPDAPQGLCLDRAYDAPAMHELATEHGFTPHIRTRGEELADKLRTPGWRARRWVVEACHSWLNRNRAILTRRSKKDENHLPLLQLASGLIAFKKAHAARLVAQQG